MLAAAGLASRRAAEEWIRSGRVTINGRVAALGESADPAHDVVCVDGERLTAESLEYWLVHKPIGVITTVRDPEGRPRVVDLVPESRTRLFPVGRLDRATSGLVLLTNDGPLHHALLHPSHEIEREYAVRVRGTMSADALHRLARGVRLEDGVTAPAGVARVDSDGETTSLHLTIVEGRKRQIRRALDALGHPVLALCRIRLGPLLLGRLASGKARPLRPAEQTALRRAAGLEGPGARRSRPKGARARGKARRSKTPRK